MARKLVFLNILMLAALLVVAQSLVSGWRDFVANQEPIRPLGASARLEEPSLPEVPASLSLFLDIGAGNLFSEERGRDPNQGLEEETEEPPELSPEPTLLSVMTFGEEKTAMLSQSADRRSRKPAETIRVRLGDDFKGYAVTEIEDDHIVLSWREHERQIFLEPAEAQPRQTAARASGGPRIVVVGAPPAAVETTTVASNEEEGRGVQVGSVGSQGMGAGGRSGAGGLAGGRGGGLGGRGGGLGSAGGRGSGVGTNRNSGILGAGGGNQGQVPQQLRPQ